MTLHAPIAAALERRAELLDQLHGEATDCVRLFHGATEGVPGLAVDRYGPIVLAQTWREPLSASQLDEIEQAVAPVCGPDTTLVWNHRGDDDGDFARWHDPSSPAAPLGREGGLSYDVRPRHRGRDPLLFLDLRVGRRRVREAAEGRSVLNLFAYTCGVGLAAKAGGAREVLNVDFAASALDVGRDNDARNALPQSYLQEDVIPVLRQLAGLPVKGRGARRGYQKVAARSFDIVVLDPPRWARSRFGAVDVVRDYPSLFKPAVLATAPGGYVLATNHVPAVDQDEWLGILRRCAEKAGRPLGDIEILSPDPDFPSPDARPPLKLAWCAVP